MTEKSATKPFETLMFSLADAAHGSVTLKLVSKDADSYTSEVTHRAGSAKTSKTAEMSEDAAQKLIATLTDIGVFRWEPTYGDSSTAPDCKWRLSVVFKQGVFEFSSQGGSDTPPHFPDVLEALYQVGLPTPKELKESSASASASTPALGGLGGMMGQTSPEDFARFAQNMGLPADMMPSSVDLQEMQQSFNEFLQNPERFQSIMRAEFASLSLDQQEQLISTLVMLTGESREWWVRFLRG